MSCDIASTACDMSCDIASTACDMSCDITSTACDMSCDIASTACDVIWHCTWTGGRVRQLTLVLETPASHCPQDLQHRTFPAPWEKYRRNIKIHQCMHVHTPSLTLYLLNIKTNYQDCWRKLSMAKMFALFLEVSSLHWTLLGGGGRHCYTWALGSEVRFLSGSSLS